MSVIQARESIRGFVLAGGLSTRMGSDKANLHYKGKTLLEHALERLAQVTPEPSIVGTRSDLSRYAPVVPDRYSGIGPLGGLHAALYTSDAELNLFLPVDLPLVPSWFLKEILQRAQLTAAIATVPLTNGRPEPLVAVYRRMLLPLLEEAIHYKEYGVTRLMERMKKLPGGGDFFHVEMLLKGVESTWPYVWFRNINYPQDFLILPS
jgi:molybdenum cofactor guanylyltransferase